tara:strand:+ start:314 stop:730 length:417 start_codon:yes stop_codon:yes gene_type:complete
MTTKKNKGGRPRKRLTKAQVEEVETLSAVLSVEQIGAYFGLGKTTFYEIMKRQPEVFERYQRGKARAVGSVAKNLIMQAREGNTTAAIFYLKTQAGWKETTRQELTGADGGPIKTEETDGKAELLARLDRIARRIDEE